MSEIRDAPLYKLMFSTDPSYDNRTIASTLKMQIRTVQRLRVMRTKFPPTIMVFGVVSREGHIMPPHIFESAWKSTQSVPGCAKECGDFPGAIRWPVADPRCGSRTRRRPSSPKRPRLGFRRSATTLNPSLTGPPPSPDVNPLDYLVLVIRWEHHKYDLPQHQSQPECRHPPGILWAPARACRKDMLPVPDPYRGGD